MGQASTKVPLNTKKERKFCLDKRALWAPRGKRAGARAPNLKLLEMWASSRVTLHLRYNLVCVCFLQALLVISIFVCY